MLHLLAATLLAPQSEPMPLSQAQASAFAKLALKGLQKEYPNHPGHALGGPDDVKSPKQLHPAFYGCYDWHSSVHGHWMLARLLRRFPELPEGRAIRAAFHEHLTAANIKIEAAYFERKESQSFERPYGWAWLLKLAEELHDWDDADARMWKANLKPLADLLAAKYVSYFPKQTYPIRTGVHPNTAFGLAFAHDFAVKTGDAKLKQLTEERAKFYFAKDEDAPAKWEPGGADFFSPCLMEADLMSRVLPPAEFQKWLAKFLPNPPKALLEPAIVSDRGDLQIVHLDGLNLSRAWCMNGIVKHLPADDPLRAKLAAAAKVHAASALKHVASGDYAGEHWLASFAVYLLTE
ncbi:MAG: DUF2891 domain-containing protein [Gemmataceae bacterium]